MASAALLACAYLLVYFLAVVAFPFLYCPVSFSCHGGGGNQKWALTEDGELRHDDNCVVATNPGRDAAFRECPEEDSDPTGNMVCLRIFLALLLGVALTKCVHPPL
jgi:hypothetical protein